MAWNRRIGVHSLEPLGCVVDRPISLGKGIERDKAHAKRHDEEVAFQGREHSLDVLVDSSFQAIERDFKRKRAVRRH